jgi:class 3 adenylate cyclase/5-methylcytosine-specific restriction endonuclease McrA
VRRPRPPLLKELQLRIFRRDKWVCRWCDRPVIFAPVMRLIERDVRTAGMAGPLSYYHAHWTRDGAPLLDELGAVIDHIEAHSTGGPSEEENLATACCKCNGRKSAARLDEWGKRPQRKPIKGKYGEPQHWDGLSALFVVLAQRGPSGLTTSERDWLKALAGNTQGSIEPKAQDRAERRQVTVMFSDLVSSTALSARMDPEDLREVISAYQKCVSDTVQRFGGFVAKYMGDGVLVYYGYPQAHEDDAERAVRAGLKLVTAVTDLKTHAALRTRVGIATGLVVVGDLIGSGASQEQAIVGETPNLAARLQGIAESNSVVIAESTRKLVGNLFELRDLGAQDLKGIVGPVRAWAALRPATVESRFDALHATGLTELVGREEELDLLLRRWSKAKTGEGQVVLLSGEPGIGKSRLTAALMERLAGVPHTRLRYFCSPQHTDSALYPIISQMERAAGFTHDDNTRARLDKLDALLAESLTPPQDAALLADMLSLPNDGRYPTLELGQRFRGSNHIRRPQQACRTKCG